MAKAVAVCVCPECGKTYERQIEGYNRADANSKKDYAEHCPGLCLACWKKEQQENAAKEAAALKEKYQLPEIVGVSDKQTAYAENLRREFLASHENTLNDLCTITANLNNNDYLAEKAELVSKAPEELKSLVIAELNSSILYRRAYAMLTKSSARDIIDSLLNQPDTITL
nr:MAG TPA: C2H2 type zinc-finger protein [Caudoviricetes sp.]